MERNENILVSGCARLCERNCRLIFMNVMQVVCIGVRFEKEDLKLWCVGYLCNIVMRLFLVLQWCCRLFKTLLLPFDSVLVRLGS